LFAISLVLVRYSFAPCSLNQCIGANQAERAEEVAEIQMPNHWSGDNVHIYVAFAADNNKDVSDSIHLTAYVTST